VTAPDDTKLALATFRVPFPEILTELGPMNTLSEGLLVNTKNVTLAEITTLVLMVKLEANWMLAVVAVVVKGVTVLMMAGFENTTVLTVIKLKVVVRVVEPTKVMIKGVDALKFVMGPVNEKGE
jgi:hypothetical protein